MSFDINRMHTRLAVRLGSNVKLRAYSVETVADVAERTLVQVLDGARSSYAIADALCDDPKLADIPAVVIAAVLPTVLECIAGAITDAQETTVDG